MPPAKQPGLPAGGRCHMAPLSYNRVIPHRTAPTRMAAHRLPIRRRILDGLGGTHRAHRGGERPGLVGVGDLWRGVDRLDGVARPLRGRFRVGAPSL